MREIRQKQGEERRTTKAKIRTRQNRNKRQEENNRRRHKIHFRNNYSKSYTNLHIFSSVTLIISALPQPPGN